MAPGNADTATPRADEASMDQMSQLSDIAKLSSQTDPALRFNPEDLHLSQSCFSQDNPFPADPIAHITAASASQLTQGLGGDSQLRVATQEPGTGAAADADAADAAGAGSAASAAAAHTAGVQPPPPHQPALGPQPSTTISAGLLGAVAVASGERLETVACQQLPPSCSLPGLPSMTPTVGLPVSAAPLITSLPYGAHPPQALLQLPAGVCAALTAHPTPAMPTGCAALRTPEVREIRHYSLVKPEHRHSQAKRRGPMDEMRQLVRILIKLMPASARYLQVLEESGGGNKVSEEQIREYLRQALGEAPRPEWGVPSGWGGYLAELFSWATGWAISRDAAMACAERQQGRSWQVKPEELAALGCYTFNWPLPLTLEGVRACAQAQAVAGAAGAEEKLGAPNGHGAAARGDAHGGGAGGGSRPGAGAAGGDAAAAALGATSPSGGRAVAGAKRCAGAAAGTPSKRGRASAAQAVPPSGAAAPVLDVSELSELDCWRLAAAALQAAQCMAGTTPPAQLVELQQLQQGVLAAAASAAGAGVAPGGGAAAAACGAAAASAAAAGEVQHVFDAAAAAGGGGGAPQLQLLGAQLVMAQPAQGVKAPVGLPLMAPGKPIGEAPLLAQAHGGAVLAAGTPGSRAPAQKLLYATQPITAQQLMSLYQSAMEPGAAAAAASQQLLQRQQPPDLEQQPQSPPLQQQQWTGAQPLPQQHSQGVARPAAAAAAAAGGVGSGAATEGGGAVEPQASRPGPTAVPNTPSDDAIHSASGDAWVRVAGSRPPPGVGGKAADGAGASSSGGGDSGGSGGSGGRAGGSGGGAGAPEGSDFAARLASPAKDQLRSKIFLQIEGRIAGMSRPS